MAEQQLKKQELDNLGICPKCWKSDVKQHLKVAACMDGMCGFKLWRSIAGEKLSETQLKRLIKNKRTTLVVKGLKGKSGIFDTVIIQKDDFSTVFEFSKKELGVKLMKNTSSKQNKRRRN